MLIGSASGMRIFTLLTGLYFTYGQTYVYQTLGYELGSLLTLLLLIVLFIMSGGGISVIVGVILVLIHVRRIGKLIIALGTGMGMAGLVFFLMWESGVVDPIETWADFGFFLLKLFTDMYFIGVIIALVARKKMKKIDKEDKDNTLSATKTQESGIVQRISCPNCETINDGTSNFCRKCGADLFFLKQ